VERYCSAGRAMDDNMAQAHCMLDAKGYKHTHLDDVILLALKCENGCMNAPQCDVKLYCLPCYNRDECLLHSTACILT
jgi:hypothetical protein